MNRSQILPCRITMICALITLVVSLTGGILFILPVIGKITLGQNTSWINYFMIRQTIWRLPIELYIAIIALILLLVHRSTSWRMIINTLLLAATIGMIRSNPYNISIWVMVSLSFIALCTSSVFYEGNIKVFVKELIDNIKQLHRRQTLIWKSVATILAIAFAANYIHNEIIKQSSEEARDARLLEWYNDARSKVHTIDGLQLKIFTDYQCPACSQLVPKYTETSLTAGNGMVSVGLYDYPLDTACNDSSISSLHPAACSAAYAARLVDKEQPSESHDFRSWLYANRSELNDNIILQKLKEIGIADPQDMFDNEIILAVHNDVKDAKAYGVNAVPSVVLNNVLLPAGLNPSKLELLLKSEMAKQ